MMETHVGKEEEEEEDEEVTVIHGRCNLGFQGLAPKTHPVQLQRSCPAVSKGAAGLEDLTE